MTEQSARKWLIGFALTNTAAQSLFFILVPVFHYPLEPHEAMQMLEVVGPVFLGYLGTATQFLTGGSRTRTKQISSELVLLVRWPPIIFTITSMASLFAFGYANRLGGAGMPVPTLSLMLAGNIGLLAVTTNVIVARFFGRPNQQASRPVPPATEPRTV